ncbi:butyrophilin-like protein 2 [Halichoeres trimaculatus]|uniref:butyrophilin-like protein 2 n=1 Tax=Halichoeres trimaculatus TaxID=147232 RepID=UPI003D9E17E9
MVYFLFLLLLPHCYEGTPEVIGSSQPIVAYAGDDVILPCHIKPSMDAATHTVEWTRPDLEPRFVHLWRSGEELLDDQHPWYEGRTSLFISELKNGNVSLKLSRVKLSDRGTYRCFIPTINRDTTVELLFGSVSSPSINISKSSSGLSLDCRSEGWFPQPEVRWLDAEGTVLSAGPTETLTGPDGLFTVSSRLNMEKTNRDSVTCRVHQEQINQTRETHLQVSGSFPPDFFDTSSSVYVSIIVVIVLSVIVAAAFIFWKWRKKATKAKKPKQAEEGKKEREQLTKDLEGTKRRLEDELQKEKEEKREFEKKLQGEVDKSLAAPFTNSTNTDKLLSHFEFSTVKESDQQQQQSHRENGEHSSDIDVDGVAGLSCFTLTPVPPTVGLGPVDIQPTPQVVLDPMTVLITLHLVNPSNPRQSQVMDSYSKSWSLFATTCKEAASEEIKAGQAEMIGPSTPTLAMIGQDIILQCRLQPGADVSPSTLEWARLDLNPRFVHVRRDGVELLVNQNPSYLRRTSLFIEKLKHGDMSLTLSKVKLSDEGKYRCHIPDQGTSMVELVVGAVSSPVIIIEEIAKKELVLQCESKGWYPEPEMLWLDRKGNLLSAGPSETLRGTDGLFTVSSRLTVEKRNNYSFTCRVHQKNINQTRETGIQFQGDIFVAPSGSITGIIVVSVIVFLFLFVVFFVLWRLGQNRESKFKF